MNELDMILDAQTGHSVKAFRTANGMCKIFDDRIEISKSRDDISGLMASPNFIFRLAAFALLLGFIVYSQFTGGFHGSNQYLTFLIPAGFLVFYMFGNINVFFYRMRSVVFIILVLVMAWWDYNGGNLSGSLLYLAFGVMMVSGLIRSFDYIFVPLIERKDIVHVRFINSIPYLSRSYFVFSVQHANGKIRKRPVMMPGAFEGGEQEKRYAYDLLKEEGMLS